VSHDSQDRPCGAHASSEEVPARPRFFPRGPSDLRKELDSYLSWLGENTSEISGLRGFFLSGGYGRGEGGILRSAPVAPPGLYNDLEFYVFATGVPRKLVEKWVHEGESRFGIDVEFQVLPPGVLENAVPSMFYYDLLQANEFVAGDREWVANLPERLFDARQIPLVEGSRLLINRGISLLRCARWASGERELPRDFCARIVAKAKLALADAVLVVSGQYHWSCRRRHDLLAEIEFIPENWARLVEWHAEAVEFKFHPAIPDRSPEHWGDTLRELTAEWVRVFLWVESARMGKRFEDAGDYADDNQRLFPDESPVRNLLRQFRDIRHFPRVPLQWGDHPRAAIWRAAALLLAACSIPGAQCTSAYVRKAARLLGMQENSPAEHLEETLRACWTRYP
jgi:hypothetical protein